MRLSSYLRTSLLFAAFVPCIPTGLAQTASYQLVTAPIAVKTSTVIPGVDLKPGTYSIRVLDNLKDRYILRVEDLRGHSLATFIGLKNGPGKAEMPAPDDQGAIPWTNAPGKTAAMRGFSFPNGLTVEFVYPKAEAVELAKLNANSVPAIDPESEGRKSGDPNLSADDRQVVTLWMLSATRVGPGKGTPAIEAQRFEANPGTQLAENVVPPAPARSVQSAPAGDAHHDGDAGSSRKASNSRPVAARPSQARLPQTASDLPLILLGSAFFIGAGVLIGTARRRFASQE